MWLWRIILSVSVAVVGLFAGTMLGGWYLVPAGSGMAGPAIALGYGLAAAVGSGVLAAIGSAYLPARRVRGIALATGAVASALLALGVAGYLRSKAALYDADEAYAGLPRYRLVVERVVVRDPVLSPRVVIDTDRRIWEIALPDGRICQGNLRAAAQARIGEAALALAALARSGSAICDGGEAVEQRLQLTLPGELDRPIDIAVSPLCIERQPLLARAMREARNVNLRADSDVECQ